MLWITPLYWTIQNILPHTWIFGTTWGLDKHGCMITLHAHTYTHANTHTTPHLHANQPCVWAVDLDTMQCVHWTTPKWRSHAAKLFMNTCLSQLRIYNIWIHVILLMQTCMHVTTRLHKSLHYSWGIEEKQGEFCIEDSASELFNWRVAPLPEIEDIRLQFPYTN